MMLMKKKKKKQKQMNNVNDKKSYCTLQSKKFTK